MTILLPFMRRNVFLVDASTTANWMGEVLGSAMGTSLVIMTMAFAFIGVPTSGSLSPGMRMTASPARLVTLILM